MKVFAFLLMVCVLASIFSDIAKTERERDPEYQRQQTQLEAERKTQKEIDRKILAAAIEMDGPVVKFFERQNNAYINIDMRLKNKSGKIIKSHLGKVYFYDGQGRSITASQLKIDDYLLPQKSTKISFRITLSASAHQSVISAGGPRSIASVSYEPVAIIFESGEMLGF